MVSLGSSWSLGKSLTPWKGKDVSTPEWELLSIVRHMYDDDEDGDGSGNPQNNHDACEPDAVPPLGRCRLRGDDDWRQTHQAWTRPDQFRPSWRDRGEIRTILHSGHRPVDWHVAKQPRARKPIWGNQEWGSLLSGRTTGQCAGTNPSEAAAIPRWWRRWFLGFPCHRSKVMI